jgi:uncharacterized protein with HEPN domain
VKDLRPVLADALRVIDHIRRAMGDRSLSDYASDWLLKHAVERGVEIISEASRRLPDEFKAGHPEIPWRRVAGIGNVLRHDYDSILDDVMYEVVRRELPALEAALLAIQASLGEPEQRASPTCAIWGLSGKTICRSGTDGSRDFVTGRADLGV